MLALFCDGHHANGGDQQYNLSCHQAITASNRAIETFPGGEPRMEKIRNAGRPDRIARVIVGVVLLVAAFFTSHAVAIILAIVGAVSAITGLTGFCLIYRLFGINTCRIK